MSAFHIKGIAIFWNRTERHLRRFNGISKNSFSFISNSLNGTSITGQLKTSLNYPIDEIDYTSTIIYAGLTIFNVIGVL